MDRRRGGGRGDWPSGLGVGIDPRSCGRPVQQHLCASPVRGRLRPGGCCSSKQLIQESDASAVCGLAAGFAASAVNETFHDLFPPPAERACGGRGSTCRRIPSAPTGVTRAAAAKPRPPYDWPANAVLSQGPHHRRQSRMGVGETYPAAQRGVADGDDLVTVEIRH